MKTKMKWMSFIALAVIVLLEVCACLRAQPTAFTHSVEGLGLVEPIVPEPIDLQAVMAEDEQREQYGGSYRFGIARSVQVTPQTDGVWEEIDEETLLWRLPIASPGAVCLSLGFTRFFMPPHGILYIYTSDESQVRGPFTQNDNTEHGELWTPLLHSDAIVVELTIPVSEVPQLELELTSINHGYRGFEPDWTLFGLGDSDWCHRDVACSPEGDPWRDQIRSVAWYHIVSEGYQVWCSGSLVNNTAADDTPYFLTAFHCFDGDENRLLDDPNEAARTMLVYWNYESATCGGTWASDSQNQLGATFRAAYWASDFALVKLNSNPPASYNVYYAGWDRREIVPSSGAAIHHPQLDLKKVSIENNPLTTTRFVSPEADYGIYFKVNQWDAGITESGSSGCPFFNSDKRIVGQLYGSPVVSTCANRQPSAFGPLYRSWNEGTTPATRLSDWLDRNNTGVTFLDGKNPGTPGVPPSIPEGALVLTFEGITTDDIAHISDGYGGLSWSGSFNVYRPPAGSNDGYGHGKISPDYVAYNDGGNPVEVRGSPFPFDFIGAYLTAAGKDRLNIAIEGYSGTRVYSQTVIVNRQYPTWIWLGYEAVDRVTFTPTPQQGIGYQFVMDNMVISRSPIPGTAIEYASADVPKDILDNMSVFSTLAIADTGRIADIDVRLDITHSWDEDLSVYLWPPPSFGLRRIRLFGSIGSGQNDFHGTILDDEASKPITQGWAPYTGSYRPVERLSTLYGGSIAGTWKLEVSDEARWDQGMLNSWSLIIEREEDPCPVVISSFPHDEGFEAGFGDWANVTSDDIDWERHSVQTPSEHTGPSAAHSGVYYMYVESNTAGSGHAAILESPCFDWRVDPMVISCSSHLSFSYHMYGASTGMLTVEVSEDSGSSWTQIWSQSGDQGGRWHEATVYLPDGVSRAKLKLRFTATTGTGYNGDIAIDDISIDRECLLPFGSSIVD